MATWLTKFNSLYRWRRHTRLHGYTYVDVVDSSIGHSPERHRRHDCSALQRAIAEIVRVLVHEMEEERKERKSEKE